MPLLLSCSLFVYLQINRANFSAFPLRKISHLLIEFFLFLLYPLLPEDDWKRPLVFISAVLIAYQFMVFHSFLCTTEHLISSACHECMSTDVLHKPVTAILKST